MARRDDDMTPPPPSGMTRSVRVERPKSLTTQTVVDVRVAIERLTAEVRQMASALREMSEDHQRGLKSVEERQAESRDRLERLEHAIAADHSGSMASIDAMRTTMQSSITSMTDTLREFTALQREDRAALIEQMKADREHQRALEQREEERRQRLEEAEIEARKQEAEDAKLAKQRKDQWLQRFWQTAKQPLLAVLMAAAGALVVLFGNCGGGG